MYLRNVYVENHGPINKLAFNAPFAADEPLPIVLVGQNGCGKSTLLAIIADALLEAAAKYYHDALPSPPSKLVRHHWFRLLGVGTLSTGATAGFAVLRFCQDSKEIFFTEKLGEIDAAEAKARLPSALAPACTWDEEKYAYKALNINEHECRHLFERGVYAYFPCNRSELPYWLNEESIETAPFDADRRLALSLRNKIYCERNLSDIKKWMMSVLMDASALTRVGQGRPNEFSTTYPDAHNVFRLMIEILRIILHNERATIQPLHRRLGSRLAVVDTERKLFIPSLDALSAGQASLLTLFGTLVRYSDNLGLDAPQGICLVDEIDAHIHTNLQCGALPRLIRKFPRIQFIVSAHSPLFVLGMEREFGRDGVAVVELPSGLHVGSESYSEFREVFEVVRSTDEFARNLSAAVTASTRLLVLVEGETDEVYYRTAVALLNKTTVLEGCQIACVGIRTEKGQKGGGSSGLDRAADVLKANPGLASRPVLLLYDNDVVKIPSDGGRVYARRLPAADESRRVRSGVESLLPEGLFTEEMFSRKEESKPDGTMVVIDYLDKKRLCDYLCNERRNAADFREFEVVLDGIAEVIACDARLLSVGATVNQGSTLSSSTSPL